MPEEVSTYQGDSGLDGVRCCYVFLSYVWVCVNSNMKGIRPVKKLDVGLLMVMI